MRLVVAAVALSFMTSHCFAQEVRSYGTWRVGVLENKFDNSHIDLVTNIQDTTYGEFLFAYRCQDNHYQSLLIDKKGSGRFLKDKIYNLKYHIDNGTNSDAQAYAFNDSILIIEPPIAMQNLYRKNEILFRVVDENGNSKDSSFPLSFSDQALAPMSGSCDPG